MLRELHITGLGVIQDVTLELAPGLNVLSGETGAGKTMVTEALALTLGQRARAHLIRSGAARASVQALFEVQGFDEWAEDGILVLARTLSAEGASSARAGGQLAPLATLAELGADLVEVHGQHQAQRLLSPGTHLAFLDRFAGPQHVAAVAGYRELHARRSRVRARLAELDQRDREREREKDLLAYQVREIEAVGLEPGEMAALSAEEGRLSHAERIREVLSEARDALGDGGSDAVAAAAGLVSEASSLDPDAEPLAARLRSLREELRDASAEVGARLERAELDPERLEAVRARLAAIRGLERKYGEGEDGILSFLAQAREGLESLDRAGQERQGLAQEAAQLDASAAAAAEGLTAARGLAAPALAGSLEAELHELGMEGAEVRLDLRPAPEPGPDGAETVELLLAGGAGQDPRPLAKVASGGELSRTMLACRTVLADLDRVPTLVFDEVDAGIGGRAGVAVGRRLARLAATRQVLVVTHLPQIACFADRHFRVTKEGGTASVAALDDRDRVQELSRMLSGMPTQEAAAHAGQLLEEAAREKAGR